MAVATNALWKIKLDGAIQRLTSMVANFQNGTIGQWGSNWRVQPQVTPAIPTTSVALDRTTSGALGQFNGASGKLVIGRIDLAWNHIGGGAVLIYDRLNQSGALDATVTSAQTTNLPTAALGRYTTGDGVWIALEAWTNLGATLTTVTVSYTNQAGTAGRTTETIAFGNNNNPAERFLILPLQAGDTGCRSVQSVTVLATTGTAGNFGVVLFKPIVTLPGSSAHASWSFPYDLPFVEEIIDDACIAVGGYNGIANANQIQMNLWLAEV